MKAIIEFDLPEDLPEYQAAVHATSLAIIIYDLDQWLRSEAKYGEKYTFSDEEIREKIRDLLHENGLSFDNVIFQ